MQLEANIGYPGTGNWTLLEDTDLVILRLGFSRNKHLPRGFMDCLDFHTVTAVIEATASFRHFRFALCNTTSDGTLSESLAGNTSIN